MPKKIADTWRLLEIFLPIWSQAYGGEEYEPDGRDWRQIKMFLEIHPDIFEKREMFVQRAMRYLEDPFWSKPHAEPVLCHQLYFFLEHFSRYGNAKKTKKEKPTSRVMIHCSLCGHAHGATENCFQPERQV